MTDTEAGVHVERCIQYVRTGSFTEVFQDVTTVEGLKGLVQRTDYIGAQSAAILAETYDQVGRYQEARNFANIDIGRRQLSALASETQRREPDPRLVRAHAWLLLQCAVSEFRTGGGYRNGLELLSQGIELISAERGKAIRSQHIQSLFYFWRARILSTASYDFRVADSDFNHALRVADKTLEEKLREADEDANKPEEERRRARPTELAAGSYVLSTILSFGLGQARQLESRLFDSLLFLRGAVLLSRGSVDIHRRGFTHLLIGTTLRGIARAGQLREAEQQLTRAKELLEQPEPHVLHLARLHHQLALCSYNKVPPGVAHAAEHKELLRKALKDNDQASKLSGNKFYDDFRDPLLDYGIKVARSLIYTARGNFTDAYDLADRAMKTIGYNVPRGTHGWALVAKGMALAERVEGRDQIADAKKAEIALQAVAEDSNLRHTDRAAAHLHLSRLYSRIGQPFKASIHYERAIPIVRRSEHGWVKDLQESAQRSLTVDTGPVLRLDIEDLLKAAKDRNEGPWQYINRRVDVDLKRRLLTRIEHQAILKQKDGEGKLALALGLTRATLFTWKRDPDLKNFFPKKSTKGSAT